MIVVAVCVLSIFWCTNFRSPSSKESFFGKNDKFKFKESENVPGNDLYYISEESLYKIIEGKNDGEKVFPNIQFEKDGDEIKVKGKIKINNK